MLFCRGIGIFVRGIIRVLTHNIIRYSDSVNTATQPARQKYLLCLLIIKMKYIILFFIFPILADAQNTHIFSDKTICKGQAVIFSADYDFHIDFRENVLFTPTIGEVLEAESILRERYNEDFKGVFKSSRNVHRKFWRYNRQ